MSIKLKTLTVRGFRSIKSLEDFEPAPVNVLIGANGAGKSNFVSFFRLLSWMTSGNLQEHVASLGGANAILHDGAGATQQIEATINLETERGENEYSFRLFHAAKDTLVFAEERFRFSGRGFETPASWTELGGGHREAKLVEGAERGDPTARTIRALLQNCVVHQFHNTSPTARIRQKWKTRDNRFLKEDGANLAPFLLRLRDERGDYYHRISEHIRAVLPFFAEFVLDPEHNSVLLQWRERGTDMVFSADQMSDGMLRTVALIALLAQPEEDLPAVLILDEPELGLHPSAIAIVSSLLKSASVGSQVIVATQSTAFVDHFSPEEIVVVDRRSRSSEFRRLASEKLTEWLSEYSLSELWEKNVLGGRP